jgi:hypothetical protein
VYIAKSATTPSTTVVVKVVTASLEGPVDTPVASAAPPKPLAYAREISMLQHFGRFPELAVVPVLGITEPFDMSPPGAATRSGHGGAGGAAAARMGERLGQAVIMPLLSPLLDAVRNTPCERRGSMVVDVLVQLLKV